MRRKSQFVRVVGLALSGAAALALSTEAWSQVAEIVVTTRKREENLQVVPIAVEAITAGDIERKGITSLDKVIEQSASLILDQGFSPQDQRIVVRGLSPTRGRQNAAILQDGIDISSEAIGTAGGSLLINPRLFDLERVEVVKGPQNALYGRSAFAGAINYITRKPGDKFEAKVGTDIGSDGQQEFSGLIMGPLSDTVSAGLTGQVWNHDGYYENLYTGEDMGEQEGTSVAGTLVWKPVDGLRVSARVENLNDEFGVTPYGVMPFNTNFTLPAAALADPDGAGPQTSPVNPLNPFVGSIPGVRGDTPDADDLQAKMSEDPRTCNPFIAAVSQPGCNNYPGTDRDISRGTLTIEWDVGGVDITSLTHLADADTSQVEGSEDVSASATFLAAGETIFESDVSLFSQELRAQGDLNEWLKWTLGGLYWKEDVDQQDGSFTCIVAFPSCAPSMALIGSTVPLNADAWFRTTDHYSVYTLVEATFAEIFGVAAEARWVTEETKAGGPNVDNGLYSPSFGQQGPSPAATGLNTGEVDDDFLSWKVTLSAAPTGEQFYYLSVAESYKPKGLSVLNSGVGAYDPEGNKFDDERLMAYEIGAKTDWLNNRLRVNADVFFYDFKNKQVSTQVLPPGATFLQARVVNAGEAEVWGAELDVVWNPIDPLSLGLSYTWLDTEYTDYHVTTTGAGTIAYAGNCVPVETGQTGPGGSRPTQCQISYDGNDLEGAPDNALVANVRYQDGLVGQTDWFVEADAEFTDDRYASEKNLMVFPSYWEFNLRAGITNDRWDISAYVDNLLNDDTVKTGFEDGDIPYFVSTFTPPTSFGIFANHGTLILPDERQYGLRVNYRFAGE